jgi:hypothetical protein
VKQIVGLASNAATLATFEGRHWMNKLTLVPVMMALASQAAGCIVDHTRDGGGSGDPGGSGGDVAAISARWSLRNMLDGATTACPVGFDTVQLIALPIDVNGDAVAEPSIDLFDCNKRQGISVDLVPDVYQVWLEVRSGDLATLYAQSLSQVLDVRQADQVFSADILNDGGYFQLSWDLVGKATSRPLDCAQVAGINAIKAISTSIADAHRVYDDKLVCEDHTTVTGGLLQGMYTISIAAMSGDQPLGKAATLTNKVIAGQNRVTDLGLITIPIDGL